MHTKLRINMVGGPFQHSCGSYPFESPRRVEWIRDLSASISFHIDHGLMMPVEPSKANFGLIVESASIIPDVIKYVIANIQELESKFRYIFTYDRRLLQLSPIMKWCMPPAKPWIPIAQNQGNKSKLISMIASTKIMCMGHIYRQQVAEKHKHCIDRFGSGYRPVKSKEDALLDYLFSINMENDVYPTYFTEKLTDCFAARTLPIFWGTGDIGRLFDAEGVIYYNDDLNLEDLTVELYQSKRHAIENNFLLASNIPIMEDYIVEKYEI